LRWQRFLFRQRIIIGMSGSSLITQQAGRYEKGRQAKSDSLPCDRKTTPAGTLDFLYDNAGRKVAEIDTTGTFQRGELYAGNRHIAVYAPDPGPSGATFFTHVDWLGTERTRTNMTGTACETIRSLPFGDGQTISDSCGDSAGDVSAMHFIGKERDSESGLDNFGARFDSSSIGRFMSPDPMGGHQEDPQTMNRYSYVRNNPLNLTDPTGLGFYLQCNNKDHKDCVQVQIDPKNDKSQQWVQAQDGKATVITSDSIRAGDYAANVNGNGVTINGSQGIYFENEASDAKHSAFIIENPAKAGDTNAMNLAAVESVLKIYSGILQQKPDAKWKTLDDLVKKQSQGKLDEAVRKQCK
jgi:RHS repeat-associated protein